MNNRKYASRISVIELISLLPTLYIIGSTKSKPASYSVYALLSGVLLNSKFGIFTMLFALLPTLLLVFCLVEYIQDDYSTCCVYIFTRTESRFKWFAKKAVSLFAWIIIFYLFEFCLLFIAIKANGVTVDFAATLAIFAWTLLFNTLTMFMFLLPMNLFAVKAGSVISYFTGIGIYLLLLCTAMYVSPVISRLLPISQGMYAWHQTPWAAQQNFMNISPLPGFNVWFSLIYLIIVIAIEIIICMFMIKRMDLLSMTEGEN